jgi:hypothetical protein
MRTFDQFIQISDQIVEKTDGKSTKDQGYSLNERPVGKLTTECVVSSIFLI